MEINQTALVMGLRSSGLASYHLLKQKGYCVKLYDDDRKLMATLPETVSSKSTDEIFENVSLVVVSPGIPSVHPVIKEAEKRGLEIISELELGLREIRIPYVMVTGTNGKTTTVKMIEKLLKLAGKRVKAVGNVGYPVTQFVMDDEEADYLVVEASSFQLERVRLARPYISVLLNLQPDHMDRYAKFEDYVKAKKNIFLNQTQSDYAIVNADDPKVMRAAEKIRPTLKTVSTRGKRGSVYLKDNYFYFDDKPIANVREARAKGEHNRFNLLVALTVGEILGVKRENAIALVKEYKPLPHRVEYVTTIDGKRYYNDSKGTNIAATVTAISMLNGNIGLILGGSGKNEDYCEFFEELSPKVKYIAATGMNAERIRQSALKVGFTDIEVTDTLEEALQLLSRKEGIDTVLFSPSSASFDRYKNYEERGNVFKQMVYRLKA